MTHGAPSEAAEQHRCLFVGDDGTFRVVAFTTSGDMDSLDALQNVRFRSDLGLNPHVTFSHPEGVGFLRGER